MNFKFSKEIIKADQTKPGRGQLRLYKVFDEDDQLLGQFFMYPTEQILHFKDKKFSVDVVSRPKKKSIFLMDTNNNEPIGEYEVFGGTGVNYFWQDVPSSPTGTIRFGDREFKFRRIPAEVRYLIFSRETWGYFKFRLYATKGQEYYEYSLQMDIPVWNHTNRFTPFTGTIESNADNPLAALAGLYLMEVEFRFEDSKTSG